ncbi:MAG: hypothetical protein PHC28_12605 [Flavobacterium sp.]|uniref:hypothetical protein n=1 Tax=Flavobacterium sp. TaxID=239 RepID=UPI002613EC6C|nr:hypothetical protein [Flavobacterium sp.]MDD5151293.1 hypothetical protein [Flavobacterium sp.]
MKKNALLLFRHFGFLVNHFFGKSICLRAVFAFVFILSSGNLLAQTDAIIKKDSTEIRCKILKTTHTKYNYAFVNPKNKVIKTSILKTVVDTIIYDKYDKNLVEHKLFNKAEVIADTLEEPVKAYQFSFSIGFNLANVLEFNPPTGSDKKTLSATSALDLGLDYYKEGNRFAMTNELHWNLSLQKSGLTGVNHIQRVSDELNTLHDFSYTLSKDSKWNFNLIVKTSTSVFTIFDGSYFKDYNNFGKAQGFLSPYEVILSPGIKYQPNDYFRLSFSPYSMNLYGLTSQQIANTGYYTQTFDASSGDYDLFVYKQMGAELNIWYDRKYKKWLEMQYRLGISSDYFSKTTINGTLDGLFITKFKIIKNVSLSHRAILKGDFLEKPFKPYYKQTILLSYSKSF